VSGSVIASLCSWLIVLMVVSESGSFGWLWSGSLQRGVAPMYGSFA
jgi:hypothetical protein